MLLQPTNVPSLTETWRVDEVEKKDRGKQVKFKTLTSVHLSRCLSANALAFASAGKAGGDCFEEVPPAGQAGSSPFGRGAPVGHVVRLVPLVPGWLLHGSFLFWGFRLHFSHNSLTAQQTNKQPAA